MVPVKALEEKIVNEGEVFPGNILKVGSFLNQQIDTDFMMKMGEEGARLYPCDIEKYIEHKTPLIERIYAEIGI